MDGSVTTWIADLKTGDQLAAQEIWERYFSQLIGIARKKLKTVSRRSGDEEDVVASAMHNLWVGAQDERFPKLNDRLDLWQILVMLTDRRATDLMRKATNRKSHEVGESALSGKHDVCVSRDEGIYQIADQSPTPDFAVQMLEELRLSLNRIGDPGLEQIAIWKLQGFTHQEIAKKLDCVERTVERKLKMIRERISVG